MFSSAINWFLSQWLIVLAIFGGVLSLIGIITEMRSQSKSWKTASYILILVGGLLTIASATGTAMRQSAQEEEARKKNDEILSLTRQLGNRTNKLVEQGEHINELTETIAKKNYEIGRQNKKIAELTQDSLSTITGGDSYCHFLFLRPSQKSNTLDLMLTTEGKYPLYDVSVRITDVEKQLALMRSEREKSNLPYDSMVQFYQRLWEASKLISVGNIGPNQAIPLGLLNLPDSDKQTYIINIMARNGQVVQHLTCRRVNGVWKLAMKTFKRDNTVQETVDPDFPRDDKGNVQW